jgi:hypothetical protein
MKACVSPCPVINNRCRTHHTNFPILRVRKYKIVVWNAETKCYLLTLQCGQESFINHVPCHAGEFGTGGTVPCNLNPGANEG